MINEISAEYLLTQLYPELDEKWVARHKGTFYRNYSNDAMRIYEEEQSVELARDGFLKLLPDAFLSDPDELNSTEKKARREEMNRRLHLLEEAFLPIDTIRFREHIQIERATMPILAMKLKFLLKEYFGFDMEAESNDYILKAAILLPFVAQFRGDIDFVRDLIHHDTGYEVETIMHDYSDDDTSIYSIPQVEYHITIDGLTDEDYRKEQQRLQPYADFLREHFIPYDLKMTMTITGQNNDLTTLDYNSIY